MSAVESRLYAYRAFGLNIHSDLALWPGGEDPSGPADLTVHRERGSPQEGRLFDAGSRDTAVFVPDVGELRVQDGSRVVLTLDEAAKPDAAAVLAAGAGLAMALTQRGWFVLHGSALRVGDVGVCVAGTSGVGKSTILAEMHRRGHDLVADGMTPLRVSRGRIVAAPGPPVMKIWPNTAQELGLPVEALPVVSSAHDKRFYCVRQGTSFEVATIHSILSTHAVSPVKLSLLDTRSALMEIVKNAFLMEFSDAKSGAVFLRQAAAVLPNLSVARMNRGRSYDDLPRVFELLETLAP